MGTFEGTLWAHLGLLLQRLADTIRQSHAKIEKLRNILGNCKEEKAGLTQEISQLTATRKALHKQLSVAIASKKAISSAVQMVREILIP